METQQFYYTFNPTTFKYESKQESQVDPLESKAAGKTIYCGLPLFATYEEPLEPKEGFDVIWQNDSWVYQEVVNPENIPHGPTELELKYQELAEVQSWLNSHDYVGVKIATGRATIEEYADVVAEMSIKAEQKNTLLAEIKELQEASDK